MTNKEANTDYILAEERKFLGEMFVEPEEQISGYSNMKVELLSPTTDQAYIDWVNSAFYSSLCTWDREPFRPVSEMLINKPFEEKEVLLLNILKDRPISVALEGVMFNFKCINVPRALTHQSVRARNHAFGQESFRVSSCYSCAVRIPQSLLERQDPAAAELIGEFIETVKKCRETYKNLILGGVSMETARNIMPMGTCTKIGMVMRLRDVIEYFKARTGDIAQDEHTYLICLLAEELKIKQPKFWEIIKSKVPKIEETMQKYLSNKL